MVDQKLAELRAVVSARAGGDEGEDESRWFPIRGDQLVAGGFVAPAGLDQEDLNRRVGRILVDERRHGQPVDGLELLVAFQPAGGRVLSVRTRRAGEPDWVRRFEAGVPGH